MKGEAVLEDGVFFLGSALVVIEGDAEAIEGESGVGWDGPGVFSTGIVHTGCWDVSVTTRLGWGWWGNKPTIRGPTWRSLVVVPWRRTIVAVPLRYSGLVPGNQVISNDFPPTTCCPSVGAVISSKNAVASCAKTEEVSAKMAAERRE